MPTSNELPKIDDRDAIKLIIAMANKYGWIKPKDNSDAGQEARKDNSLSN